MSSFDRFLQIQENLLGVDLGYDSVKIVALKKRGNQNYLKSFNIVNIPAKANQQKDIADRVIADAIKNACRTARPRIFEKTAVSGLPESKVFTKIIQIPKMTDEELAVAVPTEAARHIPIPQNELYLDWFSLGPASQNSLNVLIVAAPRYLVDNYFSSHFNSSLSPNFGHLMEQAVFHKLHKHNVWDPRYETTYWKGYAGHEVDFVVMYNKAVEELIQVTFASDTGDISDRETKALVKAAKALQKQSGTLVTWDVEQTAKIGDIEIKYVPLWKWLL